MKMGQTGYFETSEHKIRMPENHPKERIQHSENGENLKSRTIVFVIYNFSNCIKVQLVVDSNITGTGQTKII